MVLREYSSPQAVLGRVGEYDGVIEVPSAGNRHGGAKEFLLRELVITLHAIHDGGGDEGS